MKKKTALIRFLLLYLVICFCQTTQAQVTIGSGQKPNENALLDLKETSAGTSEKGLLLPRVPLESEESFKPLTSHVAGMTVYNTAEVNDVTPGYYYNDGKKWVRLLGSSGANQFFYMPSIVLPTDASASPYDENTDEFTIDLYGLYAKQFGLEDASASPFIRGTGATFLPVYASDALEYFIIYYDNSVFKDITLSDRGILKYKLHTSFTYTEKTFMNIVCKVK